MRDNQHIAVVIPALNEATSIGKVLDAIPEWVDDVVVGDNGSTDGTSQVAKEHGACVVVEPERGYGAACLAALGALRAPDIVVFLDADYSDFPEEMHRLVDPIANGTTDLVIGSRVRGDLQPGALTPQAAFGNRLATRLIRWIWGIRFSDLGPFRAVRYTALQEIGMVDRDYGWTVEMQIKAARLGVRCTEVPVSYRARIGRSKVSGTLRGVVGAGTKILGWIFAAAIAGPRRAERERLIVFSRYPEAGACKTRLIPALGPEGAADLHRAMAEHTLAVASPVSRAAAVEVRYTGAPREAMAAWLGTDVAYTEQGNGDLGERLARAFATHFDRGVARVAVIGTDCPSCTARHTEAALDALQSNDVVLGPAEDGGYYLIGARSQVAPHIEALLHGIDWGTESVRQQTKANAARLGLSVTELDTLADVDTPPDVPLWDQAQAALHIAIVIPALDEADRIAGAIRSAHAPGVEVIVVDGGSRDDTPAIARAAGARVIHAPSGRARQLNAGAQAATAPFLVFLHADTTLPIGYAGVVRRWLALPDVALGAFALTLDAAGPTYRAIERVATWRSRNWRKPYGDQAFFLRRDRFEQVGGFPEVPFMEDSALVAALRRQRVGRIVTVREAVVTSARAWQAHGIVSTTLKNWAAMTGFAIGLPPRILARILGFPVAP